jgi:hypothetical protein
MQLVAACELTEDDPSNFFKTNNCVKVEPETDYQPNAALKITFGNVPAPAELIVLYSHTNEEGNPINFVSRPSVEDGRVVVYVVFSGPSRRGFALALFSL